MKTALLPLALLVAAPAAASDWTVDTAASEMTFETEALGTAVTGRFEEFGADIRFDPDDLAGSRIEAMVSVGSGEASTREFTSEMLSAPGLAPEQHPTATFTSASITRSDACDTCYLATGELVIRGESRSGVELPFSVTIEGDRAVAEGELVVRREEFGIGGSSWGDAAREVTVHLHIEATRAE